MMSDKNQASSTPTEVIIVGHSIAFRSRRAVDSAR